MWTFPNEFPIRRAVVAEPSATAVQSTDLYHRLLSYLRKNTIKDHQISISLGDLMGWPVEIDNPHETIYRLTVIDYEAQAELPCFWEAYKVNPIANLEKYADYDLDVEKYIDLIEPAKVLFFYECFNDLMSGKLKETDWLDIKQNYGSVDQLTAPNSVAVLVCSNWESLFTSEIDALYRLARHCQNCGKALPFNSRSKYCPTSTENADCNRKRYRDRKWKSQVKA